MLRLAVQHARYTLGATRSLAPFRTAASSPAPGASSRTDAGSGSTASGSTGGQPAISLENASMSWHDELNVRLTTRSVTCSLSPVSQVDRPALASAARSTGWTPLALPWWLNLQRRRGLWQAERGRGGDREWCN